MLFSLTLGSIGSKTVRKALPAAASTALALCLLGACTRKPEDPQIAKLKQQHEAAEKQLGDIEVEIQAAKDDAVALAAVTEDKELLRSRLERIREQLRDLGAMAPAPEAHAGGEAKKSVH
jgi:hypothetical protein